MRTRDTVKIALSSIRANKLRSVLTTLGIVIGIAAVIAMLAIGQGAQEVILTQVQGMGANTINIIPVADFQGAQSRSSLQLLLTSTLDYQVAELLDNPVKFPEIIEIAPEISSSFEVGYRSRSAYFTVYGVNSSAFTIRDLQPEKGELISESDVNRQLKVAVIGPEVADTLFAADDPIGKNIRINGSNYKVIGVANAKSSGLDNRVYIPISTASSSLVGRKDLSQLTVKIAADADIDSVAVKVESALNEYYRIGPGEEGNFTVFTSADIQVLAETVTGIFTTLLTSIAGISLVVGGIGIMNIMLVSVTERTKEIGLRKAVGARRRVIMSQFLAESVVLTLLGGTIGTLLGISLALLVGKVGNFTVVLSWQSIALATSVSICIGLVFGYYPAYRAAKLNPIDALRYE